MRRVGRLGGDPRQRGPSRVRPVCQRKPLTSLFRCLRLPRLFLPPRPWSRSITLTGRLLLQSWCCGQCRILRVSTRKQAERGGEREGFSIPAQRHANRKTPYGMLILVARSSRFVSRTCVGSRNVCSAHTTSTRSEPTSSSESKTASAGNCST